MAERDQIKKEVRSEGDTETEELTPASTERGDKLKAELDGVLDEIDKVLDKNPAEFVRAYVQKGGQ